ncbi:MAG: ABC transporter permease [Brevinematia bacterium]
MIQIKKIYYLIYKELRYFFFSPVAYIFICIFLIALGWLYFSRFFLYNQLEMREFFNILPIVLSFVVPAITMGLFSEEFAVGSYEVISTTSVSILDIIIGKFAAAIIFMYIALLPTIMYPITLKFLGELDIGPIIGGYIGSVFLIAALVSIGLFASSLSKSQIISFIISLAISVVLCLILGLMKAVTPPFLVDIIDSISFSTRFANIAKGIIDLRDIFYFIIITIAGIYATYQNLENRKID